jgi:hypothetical protein
LCHTVTISIAITQPVAFAESFSLAEPKSVGVTRYVAESITVSEPQSVTVTKSIVESVTDAERKSVGVTRYIAEPIADACKQRHHKRSRFRSDWRRYKRVH